MNRNTLIGTLLIVGILILFSYLNQPSKEELAERKRKKDSIAAAQYLKDSINAIKLKEKQLKDSIKELKEGPGQVVEETTKTSEEPKAEKDTTHKNENIEKYGMFAVSAGKEPGFTTVETDLHRIKLANKGGRIYSVQLKNFSTYDSLPVTLFDGKNSTFGLNFFAQNRSIFTEELFFEPIIEGEIPNQDGKINITGDDSLEFIMRLHADSNRGEPRHIDFIYTFYGNNNMHSMDVEFTGLKNMLENNSNLVSIGWKVDMPRQEKSLDLERQFSTIYYKYYKDEVDYISERRDEKEELKTKVKWISFKQRFFASTLISEKGFENAEIETKTPEESDSVVKFVTSNILAEVQGKDAPKIPMNVYFGPTDYYLLKGYDLELERQIPLGWSFFLMHWINRFAVIPIFKYLESFNLNYGIIILLLTILLKVVLFPIAYRTYKSSAKMKVLKPEIEEISKKFPKKEDAMKKQQATMALYKKAGVNPMAGCIPMLLQLPFLIAFFRFFPASIELRRQPFLWADDLSSYDSILNLPFEIPFYGDHVSLFTLLMTASTILYTRINNQMMSTSQQMPGMKMMMYFMPVMLLFIFNNFASGLSYYYFLANIITFGQMFLIRRYIDEDKLRAKIEANKKKPRSAKKSNFQKRLEDMAKQRQMQQKGRKK